MKRVLNISLLALVVMSLASCDYQKYNSIRQTDYRAEDFSTNYKAGDPEVYGKGKDSAAVQSKYTYTANPELDAKAQKIREKLFGPHNTTQSL